MSAHVPSLTPQPNAGWDTKRWTVSEFLELHRAGLLREGSRTELIDGNIIVMAGMGTAHFQCSLKAVRALRGAVGERHVVLQQLPVTLSRYSEPEPDVCVARQDVDGLLAIDGKPGAADLLLVVEISDTTYDIDSGSKLSMYARAGVVEYWIANLRAETIERYTQPQTHENDGAEVGSYAQTSTHARGQSIPSLGLGTFAVDDILP